MNEIVMMMMKSVDGSLVERKEGRKKEKEKIKRDKDKEKDREIKI
jgi:hypothetical protein